VLPVIGEPKEPYSDPEECDHEYDEDEDAGEYVCAHCGDRQPIPLDDIIRQ
jgi:hypothetical protein